MTEEKSFYERNITKRQEELSFTPSLENEKESSLLRCDEPRLMDLSNLGFENEKINVVSTI